MSKLYPNICSNCDGEGRITRTSNRGLTRHHQKEDIGKVCEDCNGGGIEYFTSTGSRFIPKKED